MYGFFVKSGQSVSNMDGLMMAYIMILLPLHNCVTQRFELFQRKELYKYLVLVFIIIASC